MLVDLYAAPYTAAALIATTALALLYGRQTKTQKKPRPARDVRLKGGERCVVSGVALGLPGTRRRVFDPNNFALLRDGTNLLERVDAAGVRAMVRRNVASGHRNERHRRVVAAGRLRFKQGVRRAGAAGQDHGPGHAAGRGGRARGAEGRRAD